MCEHFVARAAEPFRLDELWPFTERLERFGLAGFGWGAAWLAADGPLGSYRDVRAFRDDPGRDDGRGDRDDRRARPPPPAVAAVDADPARHPAVRRPGRPLRLQPQRRPARLPGAARRRYRAQGRIHGRADTEVGRRWLEDAWRRRRARRRTCSARSTTGSAARRTSPSWPPTATPHHYAGNGENPVFTFRLGRIGVVVDRDLLARPLALPLRRPGRHGAPARPAPARRSRLDRDGMPLAAA